MDDFVYLDNAAATRMDERVLEVMTPYFFETYAVATSEFGYSIGIEAREGLEAARESLSARIGAGVDELVFTSGDTESSNLALKGVAMGLGKKKGNHIIVSSIEDFPVLNSAKALERSGFEVTYLKVDPDGVVDTGDVEDAIRKDTILVSIQHANQDSLIQLEGDKCNITTKNEVNIAAGAKVESTADEVIAAGNQTTKVGPGPYYHAVLGEVLFPLLETMATALDAKFPVTPGVNVAVVKAAKQASLSRNVLVSV